MILIRTDANEHIGTGHMMRCFSVARAIISQGGTVEFITADSKGKCLIEQNGFFAKCLGTESTDMESEIVVLAELIKKENPDFLIVDSYYVTEHYFDILSELTKIVYFDDMNRQIWNVDYLINYNVYADIFDYSYYETTNVQLLLGPAYAPLRAEFKNVPRHIISDEVTDVLVSAGGADPERVTERILNEICPMWPNIMFHFLIGALNPRIKQITKKSISNASYHVNEGNISYLMQKCDIAIAAAGTTLYELCACGIPTIAFILADNQIEAAEQFRCKGIMYNAGDCRKSDKFSENINTWLYNLMNDKKRRIDFSETMQNLVDGNGADRIVRIIMSK